jgi:hypothetical protein
MHTENGTMQRPKNAQPWKLDDVDVVWFFVVASGVIQAAIAEAPAAVSTAMAKVARRVADLRQALAT